MMYSVKTACNYEKQINNYPNHLFQRSEFRASAMFARWPNTTFREQNHVQTVLTGRVNASHDGLAVVGEDLDYRLINKDLQLKRFMRP